MVNPVKPGQTWSIYTTAVPPHNMGVSVTAKDCQCLSADSCGVPYSSWSNKSNKVKPGQTQSTYMNVPHLIGWSVLSRYLVGV
jgi:hypothetical protein